MIAILLFSCSSLASWAEGSWGLKGEADSFNTDPQPEFQRLPRQIVVSQRSDSKPHLTDFVVKSTIFSRYAFTAVSSTMVNRAYRPKDAIFQMQIPASAFISNFTMIIGKKVHQSEVTRKAKKSKDKIKEHSGKNDMDSEVEIFTVTVPLPARTKGIFLLTYEELLERRLGKYTQVISVRPMQIIPKLLVEIHLTESSGITFLEVAPLRNSKQINHHIAASPPPSTKISQTRTTAHIRFAPSITQQAAISETGVLGDFIMRYDVDRELGVGEIQVQNGYFVHYFAPKDLPPVPKNVVFVIDTSGSMAGQKIKQTKEALFTILNDLRPIDHFNIINFSSRIKVWQSGKLVHVIRETLRDAKKYIFQMSPSGGTNINDAIQTASKLLKDYIAQQDKRVRTVSLIIFLTDGRPTIAEIQPRKILNNTKNAVENKFCIFSLGIGKDVDYKLLERMSLENCGVMRRIDEDSDASAQLKGFYDEIGTPLLSDIRVDYSEDSVEYVTQNVFANYFNGSELVIAGKLINSTVDNLHVQVTASTSDKRLTLEADVMINDTRKSSDNAKGRPSDAKLLQRAWSYLTVKELLRSRLKSGSSRVKEILSDKARNLSLEYHFVTPLTSLSVTNSGDQSSAPTENVINESEVKAEKAQALQTLSKPDSTSLQERKKMVVVSKTSADGDPHFVVDFPLSKMSICFNIDGEPGNILRLVSDQESSGVTINGQLIGAPAPPNGHKKQRTYFSIITIIASKPSRSYIEITPHKVVFDGRDRLILPCDKTIEVQIEGLVVSVIAKSKVTVTTQEFISFVILLHQYKNPAPYQRDHLGFYILNSKGLSSNAHGLLGQFLYSEVQITETAVKTSGSARQQNQTQAEGSEKSKGSVAMLNIKDRLVPVVRKQRRIYNGQQQVDCWFAKNNAINLIDGTYKDYLVSNLFETSTSSSNQL
ncbi:inter-alpha-trypsin inhibitor heavy chain H5 [Scyliorhinus canicula]|uniref:inter-alpha-trypsin inhibitor heavy chain H5 n=1 Tax=Scyliorhinus canicula TaxID=7830 RepID=UPI0018F2BC7F|nr:inter-alpha-trypsin inhibitor heavy chain H5 [Scyliorhinus canicula]